MMFDVEELFVDLFDWNDIVLGYGSKQGFRACASKGTPLEMPTNCMIFYCMS